MPSLYRIPIQQLKKIGPKKAELFHKLGADTVGELLRVYPRTYEDWSSPLTIREAAGNDCCCVKAVVERLFAPARIRNNMVIYKIAVTDGEDYMTVVLFNQKFVFEGLKPDKEYLFYGSLKGTAGCYEMHAPTIAGTECSMIRPVYSQSGALTSKQIENAMKQAINMLPEKINDPIPEDIQKKYGVCSLEYAIRNIHFPQSMNAAEAARKRLAFEELLIFRLGISMLGSKRRCGIPQHIERDFTDEFLTLLPFTPTNAQLRTIRECTDDMRLLEYPMNRLIEGDVGSGKTAVAAAVCYTAVKNGLQCAFMAPTEILAQQHYGSLSGIFADTDIRIALLTGSTPQSAKRQILSRLSCGEIDLIIGTHALISDNVEFHSLGLVITDEQHRFGVAQRSALVSKGRTPHVIVMSATPIPRTLALMIFGDLDLSVLDELPPGRQKTETYLTDSSKRQRIYKFIKKHIDSGRQCYIVCPLVEKSDSELISAEEYYERLLKTELSSCRIAVLHGKMKPAEKERIMSDFASGRLDILIATTVIEVGVNVPNSTIMLIENAERFGLSQLHQLRGRVGRGSDKAYCIMISDSDSPTSQERLMVMCKTNDGFKIADEDLRLRGPGDFFGSRQHGLPELKTAALTDIEALETARLAADDILKDDPDLSSPSHRSLVQSLRTQFTELALRS